MLIRLSPSQLRFIAKGALALGIFLFLFLVGYIIFLDTQLPPIARLENPDYSLPTNIYDRHGVKVDEIFIKRRKLVTFDQLPKHLINGLLAKEDTRFYQHHGIDPVRMLKAAWVNAITFSTAQGASTLTQQTARQFFLTLEKTWTRKINEILLALKIEREFSKQEILTLYLNKVNFGDAWGVSAAAEYYFNKKVEDLSLAESATLVGVLPAPNKYKPTRNPVAARKQRNIVLQRMLEEGFITAPEALAASSEPVVVAEAADTGAEASAYYVELVRRVLLQQLGSHNLYEGGLNVYTAMDLSYQKAAHAALNEGVQTIDRRRGYRVTEDKVELDSEGKPPLDALEALNSDQGLDVGRTASGIVVEVDPARARVALSPELDAYISWDVVRRRWPTRVNPAGDGEPLYNHALRDLIAPGDLIRIRIEGRDPATGKLLADLNQDPQINGAVYAMDPRTGEVLALVGGTRFGRGDGASEFIRATQSERQPGSAFKPIIYAAAIDEGYTPATVLEDSPRTFTLSGGQKHVPQNYDNTYMGRVTLRESLLRSRNVPTVQLVEEMGAKKVIAYARKLGFTGVIPEESIIALGTHSVKLSELTRAYGAFAAGGKLATPIYILKVTDQKGNILYQSTPSSEQVISPETAYLVSDILLDVVRNASGTGHTALASFKRPVAAKTGTTQNYTDAWFMGFIPQVVAGVYVGYDDPSRTLGPAETGSRSAAPIWLQFMTTVERSLPVETFVQPPTVVTFRVNANGQLVGPCDDPAGSRFELFKTSSIPVRMQNASGCQRPVLNHDRPAQASAPKEDVDL
jgi:penicillin-binding protein 1A